MFRPQAAPIHSAAMRKWQKLKLSSHRNGHTESIIFFFFFCNIRPRKLVELLFASVCLFDYPAMEAERKIDRRLGYFSAWRCVVTAEDGPFGSRNRWKKFSRSPFSCWMQCLRQCQRLRPSGEYCFPWLYAELRGESEQSYANTLPLFFLSHSSSPTFACHMPISRWQWQIDVRFDVHK